MSLLHTGTETAAAARDRSPDSSAGLRVLHVYAGNLFGGIETLLVTLARSGGAGHGLQHEFALCFEGRLSEELRAAGAVVHLLGPARVSRPWTVWRTRRRLAALLAKVPFDRAICHSCWPHALFAPVVKRAGVPLVLWAHEALNGRHWLERWARRTPPDCLFANSHWTAASLPPLFPHTPVAVQYCPVTGPLATERDLARARLRAELHVPPETVVVLQVSRLERMKGHRVLLEALAQMRCVPGWVCWLVGGPQRPHEERYLCELETATYRAGLTDRVAFLGHRADVQQLLAAADVYCQPNTGPDSFGLTFVEALYAGLPVVTSRLGGAVEIVDESCGFLLPPADADALAATLQLLIHEPELRERLGRAGPERARRLCEPERVCQALHGLLVRAGGPTRNTGSLS